MTSRIERVENSTESNCWAILLERSGLVLFSPGHCSLSSRQLLFCVCSIISLLAYVERQATVCVAESRHETIYCIIILHNGLQVTMNRNILTSVIVNVVKLTWLKHEFMKLKVCLSSFQTGKLSLTWMTYGS